MGCSLNKTFNADEISSPRTDLQKWPKVDQIFEESYADPANVSIFPILKMKRGAISSVNASVTPSVEMGIINQSDYQLPEDRFENESIYDPTNGNSSAINETGVLWGRELSFWTVPVSLTILTLLIVCGLILCIEQRRRSVQRREQNIERQLQMRHTNRPLRNLTPRPSISSTLRVAAQGNTEPPSSQIMLPTDNVDTLEGTERDSQEAPKELLITALAFIVGTVQGNNLPLDLLSEIVTLSAVTDIPRESIIGKIIGEDIDEEKVAVEKDRGGCKSYNFFPMERASKALNASDGIMNIL